MLIAYIYMKQLSIEECYKKQEPGIHYSFSLSITNSKPLQVSNEIYSGIQNTVY
jgi:hypothetical protein